MPDLADVVDAVSRPGTVFLLECASTVNGDGPAQTVRQWFAPDLRAIRTEAIAGGRVSWVSVLTDTSDVERDLRQAGRYAPPCHAVPADRGEPGRRSALARQRSPACTSLKFESRSENGMSFIEARGSRVRPPEEAGEDEPAGDLAASRCTWTPGRCFQYRHISRSTWPTALSLRRRNGVPASGTPRRIEGRRQPFQSGESRRVGARALTGPWRAGPGRG